MARRSARDKLALVLAIVPWLAERGGARVEEIADHFGVPHDEVLSILSVVQCCEIPPYGGNTLGIAVLDDGEVLVEPVVAFDRPLRFTSDEAFGLLAVGRAALADGASQPSPLGRALAKLESAVGGTGPHIDLGEPPLLDELRAALVEERQLEITYWSAYRDETSTRRIDPLRLDSRRGHWYLLAHCHLVDERRTFRVDRVESCVDVGPAQHQLEPEATTDFWPDEDAPRVTLWVPEGSLPVLEGLPVEQRRPDGAGERVELAVTHRVFLEQLLLKLGPGVRVMAPEELSELPSEVARRVLERYQR